MSKHDEILENLGKSEEQFDPDDKAIPRTTFDKRAVKKQDLYIYEMRKFDLWPLDLVESNIHGLHSLQQKECPKSIK